MALSILTSSGFLILFGLMLSFVAVYEIVAATLILRMILNKTVSQKVHYHWSRLGFKGMPYFFWRSFTFQYLENLSKKMWMSESLRWHIRIYRAMVFLTLIGVIGAGVYIFSLYSSSMLIPEIYY